MKTEAIVAFSSLVAVVVILLAFPLAESAPITPALCNLDVEGTLLNCIGIKDTFYYESDGSIIFDLGIHLAP